MVGVSAIARPDRKVQLLTLGACCFGLFMVMLDNTVVNVALPSIQRELGASVSGLALVLDAYILVFASLLLTAGSLGDRYGRRRVFRAGLVVFTAASALCGLAPTLPALVAARALQAVGAAALLPGSLALLTAAFPDPRERVQAIGLWSGVSAMALAAGPQVLEQRAAAAAGPRRHGHVVEADLEPAQQLDREDLDPGLPDLAGLPDQGETAEGGPVGGPGPCRRDGRCRGGRSRGGRCRGGPGRCCRVGDERHLSPIRRTSMPPSFHNLTSRTGDVRHRPAVPLVTPRPGGRPGRRPGSGAGPGPPAARRRRRGSPWPR